MTSQSFTPPTTTLASSGNSSFAVGSSPAELVPPSPNDPVAHTSSAATGISNHGQQSASRVCPPAIDIVAFDLNAIKDFQVARATAASLRKNGMLPVIPARVAVELCNGELSQTSKPTLQDASDILAGRTPFAVLQPSATHTADENDGDSMIRAEIEGLSYIDLRPGINIRHATGSGVPAHLGHDSDWHRVRRLVLLTGDKFFILKEWSRGRLAVYTPYTDSLMTATHIEDTPAFCNLLRTCHHPAMVDSEMRQ